MLHEYVITLKCTLTLNCAYSFNHFFVQYEHWFIVRYSHKVNSLTIMFKVTGTDWKSIDQSHNKLLNNFGNSTLKLVHKTSTSNIMNMKQTQINKSSR